MGRGGHVDFSELDRFRQQVRQALSEDQVDKFIEACAKELAARLLAKVIKRTPAITGTLRRGWTAGQNGAAKAYAESLHVSRQGGAYTIEIVNPIEYASYVEFGHRTRNHRRWVEGKFMMTISEQEVQGDASKILEAKLRKKLGECFR